MRRMMVFTLDAGMTQGALRQCAICAWGYIGGGARTAADAWMRHVSPTALQEARWPTNMERCWPSYATHPEGPRRPREALIAGNQAEAARRYGEATARDIAAKGVH